jgi:hypothetical protein
MKEHDVTITRYWLGPGNGSSVEATHHPTGKAVSERIPAKSTESGQAINLRLLSALKLKIQPKDKTDGTMEVSI